MIAEEFIPAGVATEYLNNVPKAASCEGLSSDVRQRRLFSSYFFGRFFFMCWFAASRFLFPFPVPLSPPCSASPRELIFDFLIELEFLLAAFISLAPLILSCFSIPAHAHHIPRLISFPIFPPLKLLYCVFLPVPPLYVLPVSYLTVGRGARPPLPPAACRSPPSASRGLPAATTVRRGGAGSVRLPISHHLLPEARE